MNGGTHGDDALDRRRLEDLFVRWAACPPHSVHALKGDASDRRLFRLAAEGRSCIGVIGPNIEENRAFVGFARAFRSRGLRVPAILHTDDEGRMYLEEDLGDTLFSDWQRDAFADGDRGRVLAMYARILDDLLRFQFDAADAPDYALCYQTRAFDAGAMMKDMLYFRDHVLRRLLQRPWDEAAFVEDAGRFVTMLDAVPREGFLYRDFQSRNIMLRDGVPWYIDFQSGRRGAPYYDAASLLYDSRGGLREDERLELLRGYREGVRARRPVDDEEFAALFDAFAILRLLQALGAFGNLGLNKGKPAYLSLIPSRVDSLGVVARRSVLLRDVPSLHGLLLDLCETPGALRIPEDAP